LNPGRRGGKPTTNLLSYGAANRIVTTDESWVHHYQRESKRASVLWKYLSSPSTKMLEVYGYAISRKSYAYRILGSSGSTVIPFSEA
jgi:hypothetical protein